MKILKSAVFTASILLLCINVSIAQNLVFSPAIPIAGRLVTINYNTTNTLLKGKKSVNGVVYYYKNYEWYAEDLKLISMGENRWKSSFNAGKDWAFIGFKFTADKIKDNGNNQMYGMSLRDANDTTKQLPGWRAAWAFLRWRSEGYGIPGLLDMGKGINDSLVHMWLSNELANNHDLKAKEVLSIPYATSTFTTNGRRNSPQIEAVIRFLTSGEPSEQNLLRAHYILNFTGQTTRADSLAQVISNRFPVNNLQKLAVYQAFLKDKDADKRAKDCEYLIQHFPLENSIDWFDRLYRIDYPMVYNTLVLSSIKENDFSIVDKYLDQLPFNSTLTIYHRIISVSYIRKSISNKFLYPYAEKLIDRLNKFYEHKPDEYQLTTPKEWIIQNQQRYLSSYEPYMESHIGICKDLGKYDEALFYARKGEEIADYKKAWLNDDYVFLLNAKGLIKEAKEAIFKSIYQNQASIGIIDLLKKEYIAEHHSEEGFENFFQSLKNASNSINDINEDEKMINVPMVDWTMSDLKGKTVSFASLRGKVVIMDFWASWCVPCKASLPGMNLAYQKYKNDTSVVFYFVDTQEITNNYKQEIRKYIEDHKYAFNVLFDNPMLTGKSTGELFDKVRTKFHQSGIPLKLIIDKQGSVRFMTAGYKGSASELSDEISSMIEKAKKAE